MWHKTLEQETTSAHTHKHTCIYIYVCMYMHSEVARQDGCSALARKQSVRTLSGLNFNGACVCLAASTSIPAPDSGCCACSSFAFSFCDSAVNAGTVRQRLLYGSHSSVWQTNRQPPYLMWKVHWFYFSIKVISWKCLLPLPPNPPPLFSPFSPPRVD